MFFGYSKVLLLVYKPRHGYNLGPKYISDMLQRTQTQQDP